MEIQLNFTCIFEDFFLCEKVFMILSKNLKRLQEIKNENGQLLY